MIDMDTENKKIEDRLVCVDCISENPLIKYQTIENVNKLWIDYNSQSENILQEYKKEIKHKKNELFNQISQMRKNYNLKLNEISDKLIQEQFQSISKPKQSNQIKTISIQTLQDEQLLKDLKQLIEKEKVNSNQTITTLKNKDSIFQKEIENHLESLKQYDQLDIQQSIDILKEIPIERNVIVQLQEVISQISKIPSTNDNNYQDQVEFIKNIQEFIDQAKKYQCQINLFDQTITLFQQHTNNIDQIQSKIQNQIVNKQEQIQIQYQNLSKLLNDYIIIFDNKTKQIKKYCNISKLEMDLIKLNELNSNLEIQKTNIQNQMSKQLDEKHQQSQQLLKEQQDKYQKQIDDINLKLQSNEKLNLNLKHQFDLKTQEIINLKNQNEQDKLNIIKNIEDQKNKEITEINKRLNQKESELQTIQKQFDQINQEKLQKEKQLKLDLEKIQQYPKTLQFSVTYKGVNCQVTEGGKVVECPGGSYYYCLCEQAIPKTGKILFAFQILSLTSSMFIGIGFRDIISKNNYQNGGVGYGSYMIRSDGCIYSHHNKDIYGKQLSFTYTTNDIIIMEVSIEHKYIKWTRQNNPLATVQMEIDTSISQELYPCVFIYQSSKIKILDNIIFQGYLQYYSQFQRNKMWCFMLKTINFIQIQFYNFNKKLFNIKKGEN
ncbi:unnamed protein product [Paramecium pentaurelia]|uniref:Uncharacterized protein n=1 Tax=Paramecium pentaurelia TaxID=43138 RepID=A0A8S1WDV3_9CILI|nr:unnamed protein product [Paramecium pentaurelia]